MTTKYGFSEVRDQLLKGMRGAYPTKLEDFQSAKVLGEDVFGSPKPHPNAVLNLFEAQNVRFAVPFAAYRASIGGFSSLVSESPGTVLPRWTLASTIHGMHLLRSMAASTARIVTHGVHLGVCPDKSSRCALNVEINPMEERKKVLERVHGSFVGEREGGLLTPPLLEHLLCARCAKPIVGVHALRGSDYWEVLPRVFGISNSWDDL